MHCATGESELVGLDGGGLAKALVPKRFSSAETDKSVTKTNVMARAKSGDSRKRAGKSADKSPMTAPIQKNKRISADTIRILVVDDHPLFRHGLVQLLNSEETFSVVGEASGAP